MDIREEFIINDAAFTQTVTSPVLTNDYRQAWVLVSKVGTRTTTPTLITTIYGSMDGASFYLIDTQSTLNASNASVRTAYAVGTTLGPILEPFIQVVVTFGGSGNFAHTSVILIGAGSFE